jgi:hypothetical protein
MESIVPESKDTDGKETIMSAYCEKSNEQLLPRLIGSYGEISICILINKDMCSRKLKRNDLFSFPIVILMCYAVLWWFVKGFDKISVWSIFRTLLCNI